MTKPVDAREFETGRQLASVPSVERLRTDWPYLVPVLLGAMLLALRPTLPLDDAYITLHNARALLAGGADSAYAGSSAFTGATSAVHLLLVALLGAVMPLMAASKCATLIALLLYSGGLYRLLERSDCTPATRLTLYGCAFLAGYMPYHLLNGLETGLAMAAIAWGFVLIDSRWLALLCGTMPFIRPELAFLAAPLMLRRLWLLRAEPVKAGLQGALAAAAATPWLILYLVYTGSPVPNTGGAKIAFFAEQSLTWFERLDRVGFAMKMGLGPLCLGVAFLARARSGWCALAFLIVWIAVATLTFPGGFQHNWFRYCSLAMPVLVIGWAALFANPRLWHKYCLLALAAWSGFSGYFGTKIYLDESHVHFLASAAEAVRTHVPEDAPILVHDAGYVAWALPNRRLIDSVGLKTPLSATFHKALTGQGRPRGEALSRIATATDAQYLLVLSDQPPFWSTIGTDLARRGWTLEKRVEGGRWGYSLFHITRPRTTAGRN